MDDVLMRKLVRRLGWLNGLVTFFGVVFLAAFIIAGILLYRAVTLIHASEQKITDLQTQTTQTLNAQKQLCSGSASSIVKQYTSLCQP